MIFVRPDEVITPPGMPQAGHTSYKLDAAATPWPPVFAQTFFCAGV
jgi:hypothetical protein